MKQKYIILQVLIIAFICLGVLVSAPAIIYAHTETLESPMIKDAQVALDSANVTPVLKWVKKERETEIKTAFKKALTERIKDPNITKRADMDFFETLVRIYHEGEGTGYAKLKPGWAQMNNAVILAREAFYKGSPEELLSVIGNDVAAGLRRRYVDVMEKRARANDSIEAGREFVESWAEFVHYAERLYNDARAKKTAPIGP